MEGAYQGKGYSTLFVCAVANARSRRYHAFREGRYPIPNDDLEYNREYMRHAMLKEILEGKLFIAPIGTRPQKIADLGTGFGDWAIESTYQGRIAVSHFRFVRTSN